MPILSDLSSDLAAIVDAAGRSVVRVEARRRIPASGIIWSADGTVVTANHVVQREENITVGLPDGSKVGATLAGRDPATDVAGLRLQSAGLTAAPRARTRPPPGRPPGGSAPACPQPRGRVRRAGAWGTWSWRSGAPAGPSARRWGSSARWARAGARRKEARSTTTCRPTRPFTRASPAARSWAAAARGWD